jgi:hypothetical protein
VSQSVRRNIDAVQQTRPSRRNYRYQSRRRELEPVLFWRVASTSSQRIPRLKGKGPFGTLVLDVAVPDPPKVVGQAIGQAEIDLEKTDAQRAARIRSVVRDVVAKLPRKK